MLVAVAGAVGSPVAAQDDLGRIAFASHCAACHGSRGKGDGPMAEFLSVEVPDLTAIQRQNGGVFPFARVYEIIETGGGSPVHGGGSEMPAWGERLITDTWILDGVRIDPAGEEAFVRGRILALIDFIARLQTEE